MNKNSEKKQSPAVTALTLFAILSLPGSLLLFMLSTANDVERELSRILMAFAFVLLPLSLIALGVVIFLARKKPRKKSVDDTIRITIEFDDPDYDAKIKELEKYTKTFLNNLKYPAGFEEFLKRYNPTDPGDFWKMKRCAVMDDTVHEMAEVFKPTEIKELNLELLVTSDDYMTQFRNILLFANDPSGHCYFFLDYGKNSESPMVKILDNELDEIILLANNFDEFLSKLTYDEDHYFDQMAIDKVAGLPFEKDLTHLTYTDGTSDKFWTISSCFDSYFVHYGRNGTMGRIEVKLLTHEPEEVAKQVAKSVKEKLAKGYKSVEPTSHPTLKIIDELAIMMLNMSIDIDTGFDGGDETPSYVAAIKSLARQFLTVCLQNKGNESKIYSHMKSFVEHLNKIQEDMDLIETDEREMLSEFINQSMTAGGVDVTGEDPTEDIRNW